MNTIKSIASLLFSVILIFTIPSCEFADMGSNESSESGTGGSMARFTVIGDHLFTVDNNDLLVFDITKTDSPEFKRKKNVGFGVETIFPLGDRLFLGTNTGMYIYSVSDPVSPYQISFYEHVIACDPVVSDGDYAYVTLSSGNPTCWRAANELQIIDLQNIEKPTLLKQFEMKGPRGLSIRNDTLWLCDDGLKVFDVSNKMDIRELYHFDDIMAYDIILDEYRALVIGETGFVQYKMVENELVKLSEIKVRQ